MLAEQLKNNFEDVNVEKDTLVEIVKKFEWEIKILKEKMRKLERNQRY